MARKYVGDYRLDNVLGPNGRLKTVPVYCGDWYELAAPKERHRAIRLRYLSITVLAALALILLLVFTDRMARGWYVTIPAALSTIFLFFAALAVYRLWTATGPVTREHKDKTHDRMAAMSLILLILASLCLIGSVYHLIAVEHGFAQIVYTLFAALYACCAFMMFLYKKDLLMKKSDKAPYQIPDM